MFVSIHLKNEMVKKTGQAGLVLPLLYFHQSIHQVDASVNKKKKKANILKLKNTSSNSFLT